MMSTWAKKEMEADRDIATGNFDTITTVEELMKFFEKYHVG
jgi:iron only hydrogenase large subunit-like protein